MQRGRGALGGDLLQARVHARALLGGEAAQEIGGADVPVAPEDLAGSPKPGSTSSTRAPSSSKAAHGVGHQPGDLRARPRRSRASG